MTRTGGLGNLKISGPSLEKARFLFLPKSVITSIKAQGKNGSVSSGNEQSAPASSSTLPSSNASIAKDSKAGGGGGGGGSVINDANTVKFSTAESVAHSSVQVPPISLSTNERLTNHSVLLKSIGLDTSTFIAPRQVAAIEWT